MTASPAVRRLPDGTIDFNFYRQDAARQRLRMQRRAVRRTAGAVIDLCRGALAPVLGAPPRLVWPKRLG